ncbi:hypothetical protein HA402_004717 [Bradysia odoriphaga]|nr:hypothetical protein HA402_004717 [Bradysia odoriphaga]
MVFNSYIPCSLNFYCIIFSLFVVTQAVDVYFYEHAGRQGVYFISNANEGLCYEMHSMLNDRTSSIVTPQQMCLDVYEHGGCTGKSRHFAAGYSATIELGGTEFNDMISSYGISSRGRNGCS